MKGVAFTEKRLQQWLKEDGGVVVQTKRDEFRCVVEVCHNDATEPQFVTFTSASGKPLYNLDQFADEFIFLSRKYGLTKFDCGVMVNESFDITRSVLRSSTKPYLLKGNAFYKLKKDSPDTTLRAKFYLYDLPGIAWTYDGRRLTMSCMARESEWFATPETWVIQADSYDDVEGACAAVQFTYAGLIEAGHEGAMLKRLNHFYRATRTTDWMKMKPEEEADGIITGFTDGLGKYAGQVGSVQVTFADGSTTSVSGMADAMRAAITAEPDYYLGKVLEVRYMMRDSQGGYRHPRWYRLHPDKDEL